MNEQNPNSNPSTPVQLPTVIPQPTVTRQGQIVVLDDPAEQMLMRWNDQRITCVFSLADDDPECEVLEGKMNGLPDLKTRNAVGQTLEIVGLGAHIIELVDKQTGEVTLKDRVCFLLSDGKVMSSTASSCIRQAKTMLRRRGRGRWNPPVRARIDEVPLEGGKSACIMTVIVSPSIPATKNGKR